MVFLRGVWIFVCVMWGLIGLCLGESVIPYQAHVFLDSEEKNRARPSYVSFHIDQMIPSDIPNYTKIEVVIFRGRPGVGIDHEQVLNDWTYSLALGSHYLFRHPITASKVMYPDAIFAGLKFRQFAWKYWLLSDDVYATVDIGKRIWVTYSKYALISMATLEQLSIGFSLPIMDADLSIRLMSQDINKTVSSVWMTYVRKDTRLLSLPIDSTLSVTSHFTENRSRIAPVFSNFTLDLYDQQLNTALFFQSGQLIDLTLRMTGLNKLDPYIRYSSFQQLQYIGAGVKLYWRDHIAFQIQAQLTADEPLRIWARMAMFDDIF